MTSSESNHLSKTQSRGASHSGLGPQRMKFERNMVGSEHSLLSIFYLLLLLLLLLLLESCPGNLTSPKLLSQVLGFPGGANGKESTLSVGDPGLISGSESSPGGGNGNPLQYPCLEKSYEQRSLMGYSQWGRKYHLPYIAAGKIEGELFAA